jgi:uncharacterized repeat protein (TIGR03803 family)
MTQPRIPETTSKGKIALRILAILLFAITTANSQIYTDLYNFGDNSGDPRAASYISAFTQGRDGNLYSTSQRGGTSDKGTVFQVTPGGQVKVIHSFDTSSGYLPAGGLTLGIDGNLYGTTAFGGPNNLGTVFKITTGGKLTVLHNFADTGDGLGPVAAPTQGTDGNFYGTAFQTFGPWSMYKVTPGGTLSTVFTATSSIANGHTPGTLILGPDGNFYGATGLGGAKDFGTIFKLTPQGKYTMLHSFISTEGSDALSPLLQASDGTFYGMTFQGGAKNLGAFYKMTPAGILSDIFSFAGDATGFEPSVGPVQATDGRFYGVVFTYLFQVTATGTYNILHTFVPATGDGLSVPLFQHTNGTLYSDTNGGGSHGNGVLYSMNMGLGPFVSFVGPNFSGSVGKTIEILGQGFTGTTKVSFHGVSATFAVVSDTYLTATVPAGATTGSVTVATPSGTLTSNKVFRVTPAILSFSPTSGPVLTSVTITGTTFTGAKSLTFGGVKASTFSVDSSTQITAAVPTGAKTGKIQATTPAGTATSPAIFTVSP